jgi:uncharacterized RDD family membrane protein YckC
VRYVGFWARFGAMSIDTLLIVAITMPILLSVYDANELLQPTLVRGPVDLIVSWIAPVIATLVFWRYRSATPGKMVVGAVLADASTGGVPGWRQLVVRYVSYLASILPLGLGFVWIAVDRRKQAFHDKLAGTVVVYRDSIAGARERSNTG